MTRGGDGGCCFDDWARSDLGRARRGKVLDGVTAAMLATLQEAGLEGRTVLDVGCGAGGLALGAVERGARTATGVELGAGAIDAARTLAAERTLTDRTRFLVADGAVDELQAHDIVALNRVICCYPAFDRLVANTAGAARHVYAYVVPRSAGIVGRLNRTLLALANIWFRLHRSRYGDYRAFVHDVAQLRREVEAAGLRARDMRSVRLVWQLDVYQPEH